MKHLNMGTVTDQVRVKRDLPLEGNRLALQKYPFIEKEEGGCCTNEKGKDGFLISDETGSLRLERTKSTATRRRILFTQHQRGQGGAVNRAETGPQKL